MPDDLIRFTRGVPANESFPVDELIECAATALREHGTTLLQYHPVRGFLPLRELLAEAASAPIESVFISNGSIQILDLLTRALLEPGDVVLVERPTYDRTITTFRRAGMIVKGVPLEDDGMEIDALREAIDVHRPKLLYVIPDFQNPSGSTMRADKRAAMLSLAEAYGVRVVADIPYRPLRYVGEDAPGLAEIAPGQAIELSSFSKLISPGMRVGWMRAPEEIVDRVAAIAEDTYITPSMLSQGIVYEFLAQGRMPATLERLKALYAPRLHAILDALNARMPSARWVRPEGGFFLGLTLPEGVDGAEVRAAAPGEGLVLSDGTGFFADGGGSRFVRLPFCALTEREIDDAVARLARVVDRVRRDG